MSTKRPLEIIPRIAGLSFALLIAITSMGVAQNYGSQFYSHVNFPGEDWPITPASATSVSIGNPCQ